jgi:hypothetical protein
MQLTNNPKKRKHNSCVFFFFDEETDLPFASSSFSSSSFSSSSFSKRFVSLDFLGVNEISITNKIKAHLSDDWHNHYYLFKDIEYMKIGSLAKNAYHLDAIKEMKDDGTALVWHQTRQLVYLNGYLRSLSCSRKYILFLTNFYRQLLTSIDLLVGCNIIHNNIGFKTIVVDVGSLEKPILTNFKFALDINRPDIGEYIKQLFIQYSPEYLEWPLEIHILCYLLTNKLDSLSHTNIQFVVKNVIDNHAYLKTFGQKIVDEYKEEGITYFSKYINKNVSWIITDILSHSKTWDNYALSICYLKIVIDVYNASKSGNDKSKSKFLIMFLKLLVANIQSNPLKRPSVKHTTNKFEILMEECDINELYLLVCRL